MIFLTLGMQLPFPRLVKAVDEAASSLNESIVAQIGNETKYSPVNIECHTFLTPDQFQEYAKGARIIVGHAGIGTILTGIKYQKPLALMPRLERLGEHRNDHQLATAKQMRKVKGIYFFQDSSECLDLLKKDDLIPPNNRVSSSRSQLVMHLRSLIDV